MSQNALISLGVARDCVTVKGYGKSQPIAPNDTDWGRTKNRRIEVGEKGLPDFRRGFAAWARSLGSLAGESLRDS